jgi:hypothetical protein
MFIDKTSLRRFLRFHSDKLEFLQFDCIKLTAASWKKIFSTLRWGFLNLVLLKGLWQKSAKGQLLEGGKVTKWKLPRCKVEVLGDSIRVFLDERINNFSLYRDGRYKEVHLLLIDGVSALPS